MQDAARMMVEKRCQHADDPRQRLDVAYLLLGNVNVIMINLGIASVSSNNESNPASAMNSRRQSIMNQKPNSDPFFLSKLARNSP